VTLSRLHVVATEAERPGNETRRPLIKLAGVAKTYRTRDGDVESVRPLELEIGEGEFLVIVGPSGCGKSTLLKMVSGLLPASAGRILLAGQAVDGPQDGIGMVFQSPVLLAWRSVLSNILLQIEIRGLPRREFEARARKLIEMVGLKGFENKYPWQLSGGMQQRASICRALVHDPQILLMDEPFGALDAMTRERMNLELQRIWLETKKTVLLITHSIPEAVFLADRVVVMSERPGSIAAIYEIDLKRPRSLKMMGDPIFAAATQKIRAHFYSEGAVDA
jgi:NitT/TauT family transport system ATP-binding protein